MWWGLQGALGQGGRGSLVKGRKKRGCLKPSEVGSVPAGRPPCRMRGASVPAAPGVLETDGGRACTGARLNLEGLGRSEAR